MQWVSMCAFFFTHYSFVLHAVCWQTNARPTWKSYSRLLQRFQEHTHNAFEQTQKNVCVFLMSLVSTQPHNHHSMGSHVWINCFSFFFSWIDTIAYAYTEPSSQLINGSIANRHLSGKSTCHNQLTLTDFQTILSSISCGKVVRELNRSGNGGLILEIVEYVVRKCYIQPWSREIGITSVSQDFS